VSSTPAGSNPRVRVTGPPTGRRRRTTVTAEIDARTELGEVYMRSLVRAQLRLALGTTAVLVLTLGLVPAAFWLLPPLQHARPADVPLAWLVLGVLAYPLLVMLAVSYVRRSERNEAAFRDLVSRDVP